MKLFKDIKVLQLLKYLKKIYIIFLKYFLHFASSVGINVILFEILQIGEISPSVILNFSFQVWVLYEMFYLFYLFIKKVKQICSSEEKRNQKEEIIMNKNRKIVLGTSRYGKAVHPWDRLVSKSIEREFFFYCCKDQAEMHGYSIHDLSLQNFSFTADIEKIKERFLYEKKSLTEIEDIIAEKTRIKISHQIISKKEIKISVVSVILN